jgi:hypothetical protein
MIVSDDAQMISGITWVGAIDGVEVEHHHP